MLLEHQGAVELDSEVCRQSLELGVYCVDLDVELVARLLVEVECRGHGLSHGEI